MKTRNRLVLVMLAILGLFLFAWALSTVRIVEGFSTGTYENEPPLSKPKDKFEEEVFRKPKALLAGEEIASIWIVLFEDPLEKNGQATLTKKGQPKLFSLVLKHEKEFWSKNEDVPMSSAPSFILRGKAGGQRKLRIHPEVWEPESKRHFYTREAFSVAQEVIEWVKVHKPPKRSE